MTQNDQNILNTVGPVLNAARKQLLDLTARSRLLSAPWHKSRSKSIQIVDEISDETYARLVREEKKLSFLPAKKDSPPPEDLDADGVTDWSIYSGESQEIEEPEDGGLAARHLDTRLQTTRDADVLSRRLRELSSDARSSLDEQGFNILYLAMGFLQWSDKGTPKKKARAKVTKADAEEVEAEKEKAERKRKRYAPLILIPVKIDRTSARSRFNIVYTGEDFITNLSLKYKLKNDFDIDLPDLSVDKDFRPSDYFEKVRRAITPKAEWEVIGDGMILSAFSFAKFLMYQDLDVSTWPSLDSHPLIVSLLTDGGFQDELAYGESVQVDEVTSPENMFHVVGADSSQTLTIEEVRKGNNLVVQGPPGTGKSQTIVNLITGLVADGKTVLFVAEKLEALNVVKRRLNDVQLGDMCLELHSHKSSAKAVNESLEKALNLKSEECQAGDVPAMLRDCRDKLNEHSLLLNTPSESSGVSPYQAIAHLVKLKGAGLTPPDFDLEGAHKWTKKEAQERENLIAGQAELLKEMGSPEKHPWRGVSLRRPLLPMEAERLARRAAKAREDVSSWAEEVDSLAHSFGVLGDTFSEEVVTIAASLGAAPELDHDAIANEDWRHAGDEIDRVLESAAVVKQEKDYTEEILSEDAWGNDLSLIRGTLAAHGTQFFRFGYSDYRAAVRKLKVYAKQRLPREPDKRIDLLDALKRGQEAISVIKEFDARGSNLFGHHWKSLDSDWKHLRIIADWVESCERHEVAADVRLIASTVSDLSLVADEGIKVSKGQVRVLKILEKLFEDLEFNLEEAFGSGSLQELKVREVLDRLRAWEESPNKLGSWTEFKRRDHGLREEDLPAFAERFIDGRITSERAVGTFRYIFYESVLSDAWQTYPALGEFRGRNHSQILEDFRELDGKRMELARREVRAKHYDGIPSRTGSAGEIGIVRAQINRKRNRLPLSKLIASASSAIQKIKPVFMMSPMSVAQYLRPAGQATFDVLLVDEASQIKTVEALGAIARCKQMVVVGDKKQLPPTAFFDHLVDDDKDDDTDFAVANYESLLDLCDAKSMPSKMLEWHYRSKHPDLIAVSNHSFYDSRLFLIPYSGMLEGLGLHFRFIEDGIYHRGNERTNPIEAGCVADAVIRHAEKYPKKSLGVGTFSVAQRDEILNQIELRRRKLPHLERFFARGDVEPFFVKNLETIQGDQRDVIFISVGFAKDHEGHMSMSFGPLSTEGGERRLNVLISRAKERMEVFSSITADDIVLERTKFIGPRVLKKFLTYAKSGHLDVPIPSDRPSNVLELEIARSLTARGYKVEEQVGTAGFFVDLAIVDPDRPGRYILGIEFDGATYHSSRSRRDADITRQDVLEARGWTIHRIWSTDWFNDPDAELNQVVQAVEQAQDKCTSSTEVEGAGDYGEGEPGKDELGVGIEDGVQDTLDERAGIDGSTSTPIDEGAIPYEEARFLVRSPGGPAGASDGQIEDAVLRIVECEGPIHQEEIARRLAHVFGKKRAGQVIQGKALKATQKLRRNVLFGKANFFDLPERVVRVRDRSDPKYQSVRNSKMLPPTEIQQAVREFLTDCFGASLNECTKGVAGLFGFQAVSSDLRKIIGKEIRSMLRSEALLDRDGALYLNEK